MRYHYSQRCFTYMVGNRGLSEPNSSVKAGACTRPRFAVNTVRWGVWLGRHIC